MNRLARACSLGAMSLLGAALLSMPAVAQQPTQQNAPRTTWEPPKDAGNAANPADVSSVDAIVTALYDVISGPAGQKRDWNRMRSLFIPGARLIPSRPRQAGNGAEVLVLDVEGWIERSGPLLERDGFFEKEIGRTTETFGNITHAFSAYDSRRTAQEAPFARGINSIQLLKDGNRWWVVSIFWDFERPDNQIPQKYLNRPSR
ncbi:MAG TPA: hypothetical protein VJ596_01110 [Gemmatimonadaceae bacterium]|nr:hypothetical protein [Gemmatimonadaceae bacterium]